MGMLPRVFRDKVGIGITEHHQQSGFHLGMEVLCRVWLNRLQNRVERRTSAIYSLDVLSVHKCHFFFESLQSFRLAKYYSRGFGH